MAYILVRKVSRIKSGIKYRMWMTTVDAWVSPLMKKEEAIEYLIEEHKETRSEATKHINRTGYKKPHLAWLKKEWDDNYDSLSSLHRRLHSIEEPQNYRCSCCEQIKNNDDRIFIRFDMRSKTTVGICRACHKAVKKLKCATLRSYLKKV